MPRPEPHYLALFSLIPNNDRARNVLAHPNNIHLVSLIPNAKHFENPEAVDYGLNIGFHIGSKSRYTLATLGRSGAESQSKGQTSHGSNAPLRFTRTRARLCSTIARPPCQLRFAVKMLYRSRWDVIPVESLWTRVLMTSSGLAVSGAIFTNLRYIGILLHSI